MKSEKYWLVKLREVQAWKLIEERMLELPRVAAGAEWVRRWMRRP